MGLDLCEFEKIFKKKQDFDFKLFQVAILEL